MNATSIGWTDFTSNPIRYLDSNGNLVWACERISPGCAHCYAAALAKLYGRGGGAFTADEMGEYTPYFDFKEAHQVLNARVRGGRVVKGARCFIGDMTDVAGHWIPDTLLDRLFAMMAMRPDVAFQVLTKRPKRLHDYLTHEDRADAINDAAGDFGACHANIDQVGRWPLPNVWLGVSVENQLFANERVPLLLQMPAAIRFVSAEPLLGTVDLSEIDYRDEDCDCVWNALTGQHEIVNSQSMDAVTTADDGNPRLDWVVVGGESGAQARPVPVEAIVSVAQQCRAANVACFVKQDCATKPGLQGDIPDEIWAFKQFPLVAA